MIKLLIADDHLVLRQALCELLKRNHDFDIVAQASNGEEALELLKTQKVDLIVMDIIMPVADGFAVLNELQKRNDPTPVLVLSAAEAERNIRGAMKAGARGFVPKNVGFDELCFAIKSVLEGHIYLSPAVTSKLLEQSQDPFIDPLSVLTPRETEIMKNLAEGIPSREIARALHISIRTVDTHRTNILKKLNLKNNAELVKMAISNRMISV
jgi:DNA-binding NarL/FixJ family response regulator